MDGSIGRNRSRLPSLNGRLLPVYPSARLTRVGLVSPLRLFAFWRGETLEEIRDCRCRKISQLAGIQVGAIAGTAGFVPDVRLFRIDHFNHRTTAAWALIAVHGITPFTNLCVTGVNCCCRLLVFENFDFASVKPDPMADDATINFGAFMVDLLHVCSAFRAAHGARPENAGPVTRAAYIVSRRLHIMFFGVVVLLVSVKQENDDHRDSYYTEQCVRLGVARRLGDRSVNF